MQFSKAAPRSGFENDLEAAVRTCTGTKAQPFARAPVLPIEVAETASSKQSSERRAEWVPVVPMPARSSEEDWLSNRVGSDHFAD
jgi:hypothetical protein